MGYQHVVVTAKGGPAVLQLRDEATLPEPGRGEVRVKVLAAGTGFTDTAIRRGNYPDVKDKPPFTLGYDFVGEVDKLGADVTGLSIGQRVADMPVIGGYSQYCVRPAASLIPVPATVDPAAAACLPLSYMTAYQMLRRVGSRTFKSGEHVLIQGASGAVGTALLDLGRAMGLRMLGTCSPSKFELVRRYGATPIDYRGGDIVGKVRAWNREGVDGVFDAIGGHRQWADAMACLRPGGLLVAYGAQHIARGEDSLVSVLAGFAKLFLWWSWGLGPASRGRRAAFYMITARRKEKPEEFREDMGILLEMLAKGQIHPLIAERRPLRDASAVHEAIDAGRISGKVILLPWA